MKKYFVRNRAFWEAALIRAIRTFFQAFVGTIGSSAFLHDVDWGLIFSASAMAAILSLATSLGGLPEVNEGEE